MGRLIAIMGNTGVGKSTLARQLCRLHDFTSGLEQHAERPYQRLFAQAEPSSADQKRYALANQLDYLLLRAEQEQYIRSLPGLGIQDGGLDLDFYVFTRHFYQKGYLAEAEYVLCQRLYGRDAHHPAHRFGAGEHNYGGIHLYLRLHRQNDHAQ